MSRLALAALLAVVPLVGGDAAGESRARYGGNVEATLLGAPSTFDPVAARSHADVTVIELVFDTLYRIGADGVAQPSLADGAPVLDEKRTTARIALKKGIKLHDGTLLSAQDVAASLERARTVAKWTLAAVQAIKPDTDAIELTLRAPVADLTTLLALPQLAITKAGRAPGERPIGTGPFSVDAIDRPRHRLQLKAFDDHFAGRPYVDQLQLRWYDTPDGEARRFETGNAHVSARGATAFAGGQPTFKSEDVEGPAAVLVFVGFGRAHADITGERAFRRALDLALARSGLASIGSGERVVPTRTPVPVEAGGAAITPVGAAGDLTGARAQLADAATRVKALATAALPKLRLELLVEDTRPDDREIAERVVLALDKLGIAAAITAVTGEVLRDRVAKGTCDLWLGQLVEPVNVQPAWWGAAFAAGGDDWPVAQLAAGAIDPAAAAKALTERMPIVPLMFRSVRLWHRNDLHGVAFDASGRPCYADVFLFGAPTPSKGRGKP